MSTTAIRVSAPSTTIRLSATGRVSPRARELWHLMGQLARFVAVGTVSTMAYAALYLLLSEPMGSQAANLVAMLTTTVASTAGNRLFTFGVRGADGAVGHHLIGLAVFGVGVGLTSGSLVALDAVVSEPGQTLELVVLTAASAVAGLMRFWSLRLAIGRTAQV